MALPGVAVWDAAAAAVWAQTVPARQRWARAQAAADLGRLAAALAPARRRLGHWGLVLPGAAPLVLAQAWAWRCSLRAARRRIGPVHAGRQP